MPYKSEEHCGRCETLRDRAIDFILGSAATLRSETAALEHLCTGSPRDIDSKVSVNQEESSLDLGLWQPQFDAESPLCDSDDCDEMTDNVFFPFDGLTPDDLFCRHDELPSYLDTCIGCGAEIYDAVATQTVDDDSCNPTVFCYRCMGMDSPASLRPHTR